MEIGDISVVVVISVVVDSGVGWGGVMLMLM